MKVCLFTNQMFCIENYSTISMYYQQNEILQELMYIHTLAPGHYNSFAVAFFNQDHREIDIAVNIGEYKSHNHLSKGFSS